MIFQKSYATMHLLSYLPNILPFYQPFFQLFTIIQKFVLAYFKTS